MNTTPSPAPVPMPSKDAGAEDRLRRAAAMAALPLPAEVILGERRTTVAEILAFRPGTLVIVNRPAGAPATLAVNGVPVAEGDLVAEDSGFRFRVSSIVMDSC